MSDSIAQMTKAEFRELIETIVEQKLLDVLGDPDQGLKLRKAVDARLKRQRAAVATGERGRAFDDVAAEHGLE